MLKASKFQDRGVNQYIGDTYVEEVFAYHNYDIREKVQSLIDEEGVTLYVSTGFRCPRCKTALASLDHGGSKVCLCGLYMELWGNALQCRMKK